LLSSESLTLKIDGGIDDDDDILSTASCSWVETGKLHYDINRRSLQVCFSGIWQSILQHTDGIVTS